jgi:hypothetical protein
MLVPAYTKIEELNTKIAATAMDPYYKLQWILIINIIIYLMLN